MENVTDAGFVIRYYDLTILSTYKESLIKIIPLPKIENTKKVGV